MLTLYPAIKPYQTYELEVDDLHTLYIEECGDPNGIPVLFLHGGPGAGCTVEHRRFFDPKAYRIILFDQRGCGRSTPHGELTQNNTTLLLGDIERIRQCCGVDRWMLFGGSWGATLALLYAQSYPNMVTAMILRGIFLCSQSDFEWFYQTGARRIYPDHWKHFEGIVPKAQRDNLIDAYHQILMGEDDVARMAAAKAWSRWEAVCSTLEPCPTIEKKFTTPQMALSLARIENHYFKNNAFISEDTILDNMHFLSHIPGVIVHGRYDMICPLDNAVAVHERWNESELHIIRNAGHAASEPGITNALVHATNKMAR